MTMTPTEQLEVYQSRRRFMMEEGLVCTQGKWRSPKHPVVRYWVVRGDLGAVEYHRWETPAPDILEGYYGGFVERHAPMPIYKGEPPSEYATQCTALLGVQCYHDGSGLAAYDFEHLDDDERIFYLLQDYYERWLENAWKENTE